MIIWICECNTKMHIHTHLCNIIVFDHKYLDQSSKFWSALHMPYEICFKVKNFWSIFSNVFIVPGTGNSHQVLLEQNVLFGNYSVYNTQNVISEKNVRKCCNAKFVGRFSSENFLYVQSFASFKCYYMQHKSYWTCIRFRLYCCTYRNRSADMETSRKVSLGSPSPQTKICGVLIDWSIVVSWMVEYGLMASC